MPEGDTIFKLAARLRAELVGKRLVALELRRDPRGRRGPEPGTEISAVDAAGKHLLVRFADGHVLHTHLQLNGAWHVYRTGERWRAPGHRARVVVRVDDGTSAVCFGAPIVELRRAGDNADRPSRATRMLDRLGPDLCATGVDLDDVIARLGSLADDTELAAALLDQRVAAGIGNVFKSEICWAEALSPFARLGELDRAARRRVYECAQRMLTTNLASGRRTTYGNGLAVYGRAGRPCPRCRTTIARGPDRAARVTYWCPRCQPGAAPAG